MNRFRCLLIAMTLIFVTPFGVHADGSIGETSVENHYNYERYRYACAG